MPAHFCLLREPLIPLVVEGRRTASTLPGVFAALAANRVEGFPGLAAHQRQPWHLFLMQVGALASRGRGADGLPEDETTWAALLRDLAGPAADTAWCLLAEDAAAPALLQPPVRSQAAAAKLGPIGDTPDAIDVLITAKNHDVKQARAARAEPHHWLYALVGLQTSQGYLGRGNFGIARMNGGFGSRPLVELVPSLAWGDRFRRGVCVALAQRRRLEERGMGDFGFGPEAKALLWLEPWDEEVSLPLPALDPLFVEVCRRVRLVRGADGRLQALGRPSQVPRVDAKAAKGNLDDPWTPIDERTGGALTVPAAGFRYDKLVRILFEGSVTPCAAMRTLPGDPEDMVMHFSALVRGQGKTEGLHARALPIRREQVRLFHDPDRRPALFRLAEGMVKDAAGALRAVKVGVLVLARGGDGELDLRDDRFTGMLRGLEEEIDAVFFEHLWARAGADTDAARERTERDWQIALYGLARDCFERGRRALSPPGARREKAVALSELRVFAMLRKTCPAAFERQSADEMEAAA